MGEGVPNLGKVYEVKKINWKNVISIQVKKYEKYTVQTTLHFMETEIEKYFPSPNTYSS